MLLKPDSTMRTFVLESEDVNGLEDVHLGGSLDVGQSNVRFLWDGTVDQRCQEMSPPGTIAVDQ